MGQLYLGDGRWAGRQLLQQDWVKRSIAAHARVRDGVDDGHPWWLRPFIVNGRMLASFAVVVITTSNHDIRGAHPLTEKLPTTRILPALLGN